MGSNRGEWHASYAIDDFESVRSSYDAVVRLKVRRRDPCGEQLATWAHSGYSAMCTCFCASMHIMKHVCIPDRMCACRHVRRWSNSQSHQEDLQWQYNYLLVQYSDLVCMGLVTSEVGWYWKCHSGWQPVVILCYSEGAICAASIHFQKWADGIVARRDILRQTGVIDTKQRGVWRIACHYVNAFFYISVSRQD